MDHIDFLAESREEDRILKGNIPAADHRSRLFPEKRAVTGRAVGNTFSRKLRLSQDLKLSVMRPGSDDDRSRKSRLLFADNLIDHRRALRPGFCCRQEFLLLFLPGFVCEFCTFDLQYGISRKFRPELVSMLPEFYSEIKTADPRKSRIVVYLICCKHLSAAHHLFFNHEGL